MHLEIILQSFDQLVSGEIPRNYGLSHWLSKRSGLVEVFRQHPISNSIDPNNATINN